MFKQRMIGVLSAVLQPLFLFLLFLVADGTSDLYDSQRRHKESDDTYTRLIPFTEVPLDCESTQNGKYNRLLDLFSPSMVYLLSGLNYY